MKPRHILESRMAEFIPKEYEINKYIYRLFPKIYFIGQENCIFNYLNFFLWILEGVVEATAITLFCIYIFTTTSLDASGYSSDLWLTGVAMYFSSYFRFTSVVLLVTFKLSTHTKFWSWLLIFSILFFSLGLYIGYMWISNYATFTVYLEGTISRFFSSWEAYFVVIFSCCLVLFIDGFVVSVDFERGGYASRMRKIITSEQEQNKVHFEN